ncbi:MAG: RHS domain-containing protein, partial [candidate division Zixibacteria bacterium]|nr:RHS domain-containing protein [candidate division Zixibacteria bacterium]
PAADLYYWFHTDHLGTPYVLTNSSKVVDWKISTGPFGETVTEQNGDDNNSRFPGQLLDRSTGLNYNWNRYYQPKIGRYYETDPYGDLDQVQRYTYVDNQPLTAFDPEGGEKVERLKIVSLSELEGMIKEVIEGLNFVKLKKGQNLINFIICTAARESGAQYQKKDRNIYFAANRGTGDPKSSAFGIMQMTRLASRDIINRLSFPHTVEEIRNNPRINLKAGIIYLDDRIRAFGGNMWRGLQEGYKTGSDDPYYAKHIRECYFCLLGPACVDRQRCLYQATIRP